MQYPTLANVIYVCPQVLPRCITHVGCACRLSSSSQYLLYITYVGRSVQWSNHSPSRLWIERPDSYPRHVSLKYWATALPLQRSKLTTSMLECTKSHLVYLYFASTIPRFHFCSARWFPSRRGLSAFIRCRTYVSVQKHAPLQSLPCLRH